MQSPSIWQQWPSSRHVLWGVGLASLIGLAVASRLATLDAGLEPYGMVQFETALSPATTQRILDSWDKAAELAQRHAHKFRTGEAASPLVGRAAARAFLMWNLAFIPCYALVLFGLMLLAVRALSESWTPLGLWLARLAWFPALCDGFNSGVLLHVLGGTAGPPGPFLIGLAGLAALLKLLLLGMAVLYALAVLTTRSWARDLGQLLRPVWFHLVVIAVLGGVLIFVGEGQDVVRALGESASDEVRRPSWRGAVCFLLATLLWACFTWFWIRLLLSFQFQRSPSPTSANLLQGVIAWLPRIAGAATFGVIALAFLWAAGTPGHGAGNWRTRLYQLAAASAMGGVLFFVLVWKRRDLEVRLRGSATPSARPVPLGSFRTLGELFEQEGLDGTLVASLFIGLSLLLGFLFYPIWLGQQLGAGATLLLMVCFWLPFVSLLLYVGFQHGFPGIRFALLGVLLFSPLNDNHAVRVLDGSPLPRPSVEERLRSWHEAIDRRFPGETDHVLYLVTAEGGGIRAAYWTAAVLGQLQDQGKDQFAPRVFAISGVSGGSLGAAVFAAEVAAPDDPGRSFVKQSRFVLGKDLLSPTLGALLFPDLLQSFLPPVMPWDRATTLEQSWEQAWGGNAEPFERDFLELWRGSNAIRVPSLFLNTTVAESGTRAIVSNLALRGDFPDVQDTLDWSKVNLRLSTAVHLSARFPYVSPPGTFATGQHLVDGGYFENSGCATASEILDVVLRERAKLSGGHTFSPVVLIITNASVVEHAPVRMLSGLLIPPSTILRTRKARGDYAERTLAEKARQAHLACRHFGLQPADVKFPLGWMLSRLAQDELDAQARRVDFGALKQCRGDLCACDDLGGVTAAPEVAVPAHDGTRAVPRADAETH